MNTFQNDDAGDMVLAMALASGKTWREAAAEVGVGVSTVTRRMREPNFRALILTLRRSAVEQAAGLLAKSMADAATQLGLIATDGVDEGNRLRAAVSLLQLGLRFHEQLDLAERISALEESSGGKSQTNSSSDRNDESEQ